MMPGNHGQNSGHGWKAPCWAFVDQKLMESYHYRLHECYEMSLADIEVHFAKLAPTVSEPDWFVSSVRGAPDVKTKLLALRRMMGGSSNG